MNLSFSNVLLLSNLGVDIGRPDFRLGSYVNFLLPIAKILSRQSGVSAKLLANSHVAASVRKASFGSGISDSEIISLDTRNLIDKKLEDFMIQSYNASISDVMLQEMTVLLDSAFGDWRPDIIISWEAPTDVFRAIYPDATVLDVMPGMFARPPYPLMVSIDTRGLYRNCWYSEANLNSLKAPDQVLDRHYKLRQYFEEHFKQLNDRGRPLDALCKTNFEKSVLIPLQVSQYFGWKMNTTFDSQFEYLNAVIRNLPNDRNGIVTQYTGNFANEFTINDENAEYLKQIYPNLIYNVDFEKLDNFSQYLVPEVETVVSVSSTIGLQAKFFGKRLISPSSSHLSYIADSCDLSSLAASNNTSQDHFMAAYFGRTNYLQKRLVSDGDYLAKLLTAFVERRNETSIESFPQYDLVHNENSTVKKHSSLTRSASHFSKVFETTPSASDQEIISRKDAIMASDVDIVSFDVFDTLVCRTVLSPSDIFKLMQSHLEKTYSDKLCTSFVENFARTRVGQERLIRFRMDNIDNSHLGEMTIREVYEEMLEAHNLPTSFAAELIEIEEEMELACLVPRRVGMELFNHALESGKRIVLISDFIHSGGFVERVLNKCGCAGWDQLFVSSEIGLKKHTGDLFTHVTETLGISASRILHIGDNPHGDLKMALARGLKAQRIKSGPSLVREALMARKFNTSVVDKSIFVGAILSAFSNRYMNFGSARSTNSKECNLIENGREFGFLTLGPIMQNFSHWILEEAKSSNCEQIVFLARDCKLPYEILKFHQKKSGEHEIKLSYIPASRIGVSGIDIYEPSDLLSTRVDDFEKSRPLTELLENRFHLSPSEVSEREVAKWTKKRVNHLKVSDLPEEAIFRIAQASANLHWDNFIDRIDSKRATFIKGLAQWGCDTSKKTIIADFGYKGTIFKKICGLFDVKPVPRFFMSYANEMGCDPVENCKSFYLSNQVAHLKGSDPFLQYNLIIETIINEGVGSALGYLEDGEQVSVIRDDSVDQAHEKIVSEIHKGALEFSDYWDSNCKIINEHTAVESQMLAYLLSEVLSKPTQFEASILSDLVFDNGYSGHKPRRIIERNKNRTGTVSSLWREGSSALYQASGLKQPLRRELKYTPIARYFIAKFGSARLLNKFDRDPRSFFDDSPKNIVRQVGRIFF